MGSDKNNSSMQQTREFHVEFGPMKSVVSCLESFDEMRSSNSIVVLPLHEMERKSDHSELDFMNNSHDDERTRMLILSRGTFRPNEPNSGAGRIDHMGQNSAFLCRRNYKRATYSDLKLRCRMRELRGLLLAILAGTTCRFVVAADLHSSRSHPGISVRRRSQTIPIAPLTNVPTIFPTKSAAPSSNPSSRPSSKPSISAMPTFSAEPSQKPSQAPTSQPSVSAAPTTSLEPSTKPSVSSRPSVSPTIHPSAAPSISAMPTVSVAPSSKPSLTPTSHPSASPSVSAMPTVSSAPSARPSLSPSNLPTVSPAPSARPSVSPTNLPTVSPAPSARPSVSPTNLPSVSAAPVQNPSVTPSFAPSGPWNRDLPLPGRFVEEVIPVSSAYQKNSVLSVRVAVESDPAKTTTLDESMLPQEIVMPDRQALDFLALLGETLDEIFGETTSPTSAAVATMEPTPRDFTFPDVDIVLTGAPSLALAGTSTPTLSPMMPPVETAAPTASPVSTINKELTGSPITNFPTLNPRGEGAACSSYPACGSLENDCCPNVFGAMLDCCFSVLNATTSAPTAAPIPPPTATPTIRTETGQPMTSTTAAPWANPTDPPVVLTEVPNPAPTVIDPSPTLVTNQPVTGQPVAATESPSLRPVSVARTAGPIQSTSTPTSLSSTLLTTGAPTMAPSSPPSVSSAPSESPMPSALPTPSFEYDKASLKAEGVRLTLRRQERRLQDGSNITGTNCYQVLDDTFRSRIESEVKAVIPRFETLRISLLNVTKSSTATTISYVFDVLIEIRSPVNEHSVRRYIEGPFDSEDERTSFTEVLRATGCSDFASLNAIEVYVPRTEQQASSERGGPSSAGLIAGLALATASIVMLGVTFIYVRLRNKGGLQYDDDAPLADLGNENVPKDKFDFASEIDGVQTNTDISTLGDPIPLGTIRHNDEDQSTIGSAAMEYDFKKAFQDTQSVTDSQLGDSSVGSPRRAGGGSLDDPSLTSDIITMTDETFGSAFGGEEQFDVVAPAGLLGLILESSVTDGRPTVHVVKPNSVLAHVVQVGDRVVSVDNQYVSTMRASDVSRLIAAKKDSERILVFSRSSKNSTFRIQEDAEEGDEN